MTRCKICDIDKNGCCICGFCVECLAKYGHEGCSAIIKQFKELVDNEKQGDKK